MDRSNCGFRIYSVGDEVRFESARPAAYWALFGALLLLLIFVANAAVQAALSHRVAAGILAGLATACAPLAYFAWRSVQRRRAIPPVDYVLHLPSAQLRDHAGQCLCEASQLTWSTRFDPFDSTRGVMYFLEMQWPGGKARVYKEGGCSGARQELGQVRDEILAHLR